MKHIYLVRHGESRSNKTGILEGFEAPLSLDGIAQAKKLAQRLSKMEIDSLVTSTMLRAQQTAEIISKKIGKKVIIMEDIHERIKPNKFYGMNTQSAQYKKISNQFEQGKLSAKDARGGETYTQMLKRAKNVLNTIKDIPGESIVIVTHGVFMRMIILSLLLGDTATSESALRFRYATLTENTGITHITFDTSDPYIKINKGWRLNGWNDSSHVG